MAYWEESSLDLLVLQGSAFCNIACRYCYVRGRDDVTRMSDRVLDAIGRNVLASRWAPDTLAVAWHAGEPLALPVAWLDAACARLEAGARAGQRLRFGVQTNAIPIDDAWIDLFRRRDFSIGVSVDGPRDLHDANRVDRRGAGTFDRTMAGIGRLRDAGMPFDVIAVLSDRSLDEADRLFDFFVGLGAQSVGFNIEEIEGPHAESSLDRPGVDTRYRCFLEEFVSRHSKAGEPFRLRALEQVRAAAGKGNAARGNSPNRPLSILTIAQDGGMSTFCPELIGTPDRHYANFVFGNVTEGGPEALLANVAFRRLRRDIEAGRRRCARTCGYYDLCRGGAPGNKYFETGRFDVDETLYCRLTVKQTVEAVLAAHEKRCAGTGPKTALQAGLQGDAA